MTPASAKSFSTLWNGTRIAATKLPLIQIHFQIPSKALNEQEFLEEKYTNGKTAEKNPILYTELND